MTQRQPGRSFYATPLVPALSEDQSGGVEIGGFLLPAKYRTLVIDPPWDYSNTTFRSGAGHGAKYANRPLPYPSMSLDELKALPVSALAEDDAALFLWTTSRYLPQAFDVVKAWGFRYVQMLVWAKPGPMPMAMPFAPPATEFLLGCKKGNPPRKGAFPSSCLVLPQGRHSAKPEAFLDYIEDVGHPPYLEMFARRQRLGWGTWGNECFIADGLPSNFSQERNGT